MPSHAGSAYNSSLDQHQGEYQDRCGSLGLDTDRNNLQHHEYLCVWHFSDCVIACPVEREKVAETKDELYFSCASDEVETCEHLPQWSER
jgi:hypothetical protein